MKVLVVGISAVAKENYLPYLQKMGVELGLYNRTVEAAEEAAAIFGGSVLPDLEAAGQWADIAFVLTTEGPRYELVNKLINVGTSRIFCEKPFVAKDGLNVVIDDFIAGARLLDMAKIANIEIAQQFNYRFMAPVTTALNAAIEHDLGQVCSFTVQSHFGCWAHVIDLVNLITGGIEQINAMYGPLRVGNELESKDVAVSMRSQAGVVGTVLGTVATAWNTPLFRINVTYEHGGVEFADFSKPVKLTVGDDIQMLPLIPDLERWDQYRASFGAALNAYFEAIESGSVPPVSGHDGVEELRLEAAIRLSADNMGRPVILSEDLKYPNEV